MPISGCSPDRRSAGFTLVELLVVIAIVAGTVSLVPLAYQRFTDNMQYRATVRHVLDTLSQARLLAAQQAQPQRVFIDWQANTFGIDGLTAHPIPPSLQFRATVGVDPSAGVLDTPHVISHFEFYPQGGASGGRVMVIRASGAGQQIDIDWLTGRFTVQNVGAS